MSQNIREERLKILAMAAEKKVTVEEAERLMDALDKSHRAAALPKLTKKFFRVIVKSSEADVDVKVPLQLIAAGMNVSAFLPQKAAKDVEDKISFKHGLDFSKMNEEALVALQELEINITSEKANVKVFCE